MNRLILILQPITIILSLSLLVLVILDALTYGWNTAATGFAFNNGGFRVCAPWTPSGCAQLWREMGIKHAIGLILHLISIPVIITMIIIMTLGAFTRVIRKRKAIVILIITSWTVFSLLLANVILRITVVEKTKLNGLIPDIKFSYHYDWQMYVTLASLIVSFLITQIIAYCGWVRPMTTMLSIDGHFQRYDYPRMQNFDKRMVSVKEIDTY